MKLDKRRFIWGACCCFFSSSFNATDAVVADAIDARF